MDDEVRRALEEAADAAYEKKGFQIEAFAVGRLTSLADVFLFCSGGNVRQVSAIADEVVSRLKSLGHPPLHVEGGRGSEWILLDFGDLVMHVFTEERRAFYGLESLWADGDRVAVGHPSSES